MSDQGESLPAPSERVFLDAGVLMAAALGGGCAKLWNLAAVRLVTSEYAALEAWINLDRKPASDEARNTLADLLSRLEMHARDENTPVLFTSWTLSDPNDVPILLAAIESRCHYLLTADVACFGRYMGETLDGVTILKPGVFLGMHGIVKPKKPQG